MDSLNKFHNSDWQRFFYEGLHTETYLVLAIKDDQYQWKGLWKLNKETAPEILYFSDPLHKSETLRQQWCLL